MAIASSRMLRKAQAILKASSKHSNPDFREMGDYVWIRVADLTAALAAGNNTFTAQTIDGSSRTLTIYRYSFDILSQVARQGIFNQLQ